MPNYLDKTTGAMGATPDGGYEGRRDPLAPSLGSIGGNTPWARALRGPSGSNNMMVRPPEQRLSSYLNPQGYAGLGGSGWGGGSNWGGMGGYTGGWNAGPQSWPTQNYGGGGYGGGGGWGGGQNYSMMSQLAPYLGGYGGGGGNNYGGSSFGWGGSGMSRSPFNNYGGYGGLAGLFGY